MGLIDFILNLAGVLLWMNWRSHRLDPLTRATPATLVGTIRRTDPTRLNRWSFLLLIALLILLRAGFYKAFGPAVNWTPKLDLGAIAPAFRANSFAQQLLFSFLSFLRTLVIFYCWLLVLAIINRHVTTPDPLQRLLLLQLGKAAQWPVWLKIAFPIVAGGLLWLLFYPLLGRMGVINWAPSKLHLAGQCLVVGSAAFLSLEYFLIPLLSLHLIASYVYLGNSPFWQFISTTSQNLLMPLRSLPLRLGKFDFAPLLAILLVALVLNFLPALRGVLNLKIFSQSATSHFFNRLILWPG